MKMMKTEDCEALFKERNFKKGMLANDVMKFALILVLENFVLRKESDRY